LLRNQDNVLTIGVQNVFVKQQLERRFNQLVIDTLKNNGITPERIEYKIDSSAAQKKKTTDETIVLKNPEKNQPAKTSIKTGRTALTHKYRQGLNAKYTFENFIVGSGNELAYAACQAVTQNPGTKYNPL